MIMKKQKPKIMVIEDDESDQNMLSDFLAAIGYDVTSVRDARQTIELVQQTSPELIFMALMLNDMVSGDELVEKLKSQADFNIPIVGMSSQVNTDAEYFYSLCDYRLAKPVSIGNISEIIARVFQMS